MIARVESEFRRLRRALSRSEWTARLVGVPDPDGPNTRPGLVIVQIDGLSHAALLEGIDDGILPFVTHLLADEGYELHRVYSGLPSSTPAAQAELFYGVPMAVPAFGFVDHHTGRLVRMWMRDVARDVERRLASGHRSLLAGGSSYCNVYTGEAAEARFCMASMAWTDAFRTRHAVALPAVAFLYAPDLLRAAVLVGREVLAAPGGLLVALRSGQDVVSEVKFAWTRAILGVLVREIVVLAAMVDIARGLPVVHLNLLGYDEYAHRRGPSSPLARHALSDIDAVLSRLMRAARRSGRRSYDLWIVSDHGQEETIPYVEQHGRPVSRAVEEVFEATGLQAPAAADAGAAFAGRGRWRLHERLMAKLIAGLDLPSGVRPPGRVAVTAQGPLGHVYAPRPLSAEERDLVATRLVERAGIPLVVAAAEAGTARAWTDRGVFLLPDQAGEVLGARHPYLAEVADDLVRLCRHPDAGDLVISGWRLGERPLSFPHENGSHAGPGPGETDAFALVPSDTPLPRERRGGLRAAGLREAALRILEQRAMPVHRARSEPPAVAGQAATIRVMTYNIHGCVGLDGRLSPARIARVIARHDPDVVALQEVDVGRARSGGIDQAQVIAEQLEMLLHFHPVLAVEEEHYGDAILSRMPMRLVRLGRLPALDRDPPTEPRGALWVEVGEGDSALQVINTHLSLHPLERRLQVEALMGPDWVGGATSADGVVLCGDFNALSWFPACRRITRALRDVQVGLAGYQPRRTFWGRFPLGRIDHIFVGAGLEVVRADVPDDAISRVASDHLPVVVDVRRAPASGTRGRPGETEASAGVASGAPGR